MIDKQAITLINRDLELKWGRNMFRLTWANDEFETRHRVLTLLDNSGNYLGEREETATLPKYSYLKDRFIIERCYKDKPFKIPPEVKDWNGWEIIWAFEEHQEPNLEVCMFLANVLMEGVKQTLKDHYDSDKEKFDKEVLEAYEILEDASPYIATMLQNKEAIVVPEMPKKEDDVG